MKNGIQNLPQLNNRSLINSYQKKQREKINNIIVIKQDFKNSITHWQCIKKIERLKRSLQNKE